MLSSKKNKNNSDNNKDNNKDNNEDINLDKLKSHIENTITMEDWENKQDPTFIKKVINLNYKLIYVLAKKYSHFIGYDGQYFKIEDLISEGLIGLMFAVYNFNPNLKVKLSTYIYTLAKTHILNFIRKFTNAYTVTKHNIDDLGKDIVTREIVTRNFKSIDKSINADGQEWSEFLFDDYDINEEFFNEEKLQILETSLGLLSEIERNIIIDYWLNNLSLQNLSTKYDLSRESMRLKTKKIFEKIRAYILSQLSYKNGYILLFRYLFFTLYDDFLFND